MRLRSQPLPRSKYIASIEIPLGFRLDGNRAAMGGDEHVAVYSKTRRGKTSGFCIPACFHCAGSLVVLDIKRQIYNATAGHRATRLGQEIYLLDPGAPDGRTHRWNPMATIVRDSDDRFTQISRIANMIFPDAAEVGGTSNADKFWEPAARDAFIAVSMIVAETPEWDLTTATINSLFKRGDGIDALVRKIKERRAQDRPQYSQAAVDGISDYINGAAEQVGGIRKTTAVKLAPWLNHRIAAATAASDFDLRDLRRKPMTIYVAVSPGNMATFRPYLALFFEQLVNLNVDKTIEDDSSLNVPVLLMLDEFARLGHMRTLAEGAQFVAGYGMRICYVIQNKRQIEKIYGPAGALDIIDNTGLELVFGTNDLQTTEEVSKRWGTTTATALSTNRPRFFGAFQWNKQGEASRFAPRPGMLPQEIARMSPDCQIGLRDGMNPMLLRRIPWFNDPEFKDKVLPPPIIPRLEWTISEDDKQTRLLPPRPPGIGGLSEGDIGGSPKRERRRKKKAAASGPVQTEEGGAP